MALGAPSLTSSNSGGYRGGSRIGGSSSGRFATNFGAPVQATQWSPRGVPETLETDALAPLFGYEKEGGTMKLIEQAARAPGYVMERPVAAASEITSGLARSMGLISEDQDVLDMAGGAIRDIPFVGDHIGNGIGAAMAGFNTVSDAVPTLLNARYARIIDEIGEMDDDEQIPWQLSATIPESWNRIGTVGDLKRHMQEGLGWTPEMMQQAMSGERGWMDFAWGPKTFANEFADAATRMVADPFNLMLGAGVVLKGVKLANTSLRALRAGTRMTAAVRAEQALPSQLARMAIHKGSSVGVTSTGLGYSLVDMSRRFLGGPFAQYRKVALATTGGQVAMQGIGQGAGALGLSDTILGDIGRIGESIAEKKPLSENDLYMLAMIFTFPGGKIAKSGVKRIRKAPIIGIDNALWTRTETAGLRHLAANDPSYAGLSDEAIRSRVIQEFGGEDSYEAFLANAARDSVALKEGLLNISDNAAVTRRKIDNISALGFHIQAMQRRAMRRFGKALDEGSIRPADLVRALDHFTRSRGGVMEAALDGGQATRRVSVREVAQVWKRYEAIAKQLDEAFEGGSAIAPGINDTAYTVEGLAHIRQMIKDEMDADGMIDGAFLQDQMMTQPALIKHLGDSEVQKAFAGHKRVNAKQVLNKLDSDRVKSGAWTFNDLFGDQMKKWEMGASAAPDAARAVRTGSGRATARLRQGEKLPERYRPERGQREVVVIGRGYDGPRSGGANPVTVGMIREARGLPENAAGTQATLSALEQAGYEVEAATQIVRMQGKALEAGSSIRMGELTDITTLEQVAAITLESTGGKEALIIQRGTALDNGAVRNAAEFQWDLPERLTEEAYDTLLQDVKRVFGDAVIVDDTNGVVRVIIRKDKPDPRLFAHLRAVSEATGVQPSVERLHVKTVRNGRKPLKKDPDGTRTVKQIADDAKRDPSGVRYANASESVREWKLRYRNELGRADGVVGSRGPDAPADAVGPGGTAQDVGGSGARRAGDDAPLTRYESLRGSKPIGRRGKYVADAADDAVIAESTRVFGADGTIRPGDLAFRSDDGFFAIVRDGELKLHRPRGGAGDWDDFLAHVSEYATFVRVPGRRTKRAGSTVFHPDTLAEHGWRAVTRVTGREGDVYLVRDVAGELGNTIAPEIPPVRLGGWASVRDNVMKLDVQMARAQAKAQADLLHGAGAARLRIPDVEAQGNQILELHTPAEIRDMYRAKSDDPALQHAMRQLDSETIAESAEEAAYAVASDVPEPPARRIGLPRTFNLGLTRKTPTGRLRSHRRNANEMYSASVKPKKAGEVINPVSVEVMRDPRAQLFLADDGLSGAVVTADGDLVNVFGKGDELNDILVEAREVAYTTRVPEGVTGPPGAWRESAYADVAQPMKVSDVRKLPAGNELGKTDVAELSQDIAARGYDEPIIIGYNPKTKTAKVIEGNHRVAASPADAEIPVRVVRDYATDGAPVRGMEAVDGYVPGDMKPSQIGLPVSQSHVGRMMDHGFEPVAIGPNGVYMVKRELMGEAPLLDREVYYEGIPETDVPKRGTGWDEMEQVNADLSGRPDKADRLRSVEIKDGKLLDKTTGEEVKYLYRAVSEEDWKLIQERGYMQSDGRMNLAEYEGTVASASSNVNFYLPGGLFSDGVAGQIGQAQGRVLRIDFDPADGWWVDTDGYVKTNGQIPIERVGKTSPRINRTTYHQDTPRDLLPPSQTFTHTTKRFRDPDLENLPRVLDEEGAYTVQRDNMRAEAGQVPDDVHKAAIASTSYGPGVVEYVANMERAIANDMPKMHNSLEGVWGEMTPRQRMKMAQIERELRQMGSQYTLKATPAGSPSYFTGQGAAFREVVGDWNNTYLGSKKLFEANTMVADLWDKIANPVYAAELNRLTTNTFFNTMQDFGVDNKTSKAILRDLRQKFEESPTVSWSGNKLLGRMEHLNGSLMTEVFKDHLTPDQAAAMTKAGVRPQDVVRRSSGRVYRWLNDRVGPLSEDGGNRALRKLEDVLYEGTTGAALQNLSVGAKVVYSVWRFALDPRWYLINRFEADILMAVRSGKREALGIDFRGRRKAPHARTQGPGGDMLLAEQSSMFQKHRRQGERYAYADIDESMFGEQMQAGWMDMRSLNGYIAVGLEAEAKDTTFAFMREMLEDPTNKEIRGLIDRFETEGLTTPQQWADEFHRMLYEWDETGVRATLDAEADKLGMLAGGQYDDLLDQLYVRHQQSYLSMQRLMRGNINRSNLERVLNNPFLYWPISYQLKAGRWMLDTLFNRFGGRQTGFAGAGALTHWMDTHERLMEENPEYAKIFIDHPYMWRMASQMVPMTPFDMGTYMARWTRYGSNWVAGTINEDLRDERYPQDILSFIERSAALGPAYSLTTWTRAMDEVNTEDDEEGDGPIGFRK